MVCVFYDDKVKRGLSRLQVCVSNRVAVLELQEVALRLNLYV